MHVFLTFLNVRLEFGRGKQSSSCPRHHQSSARPCK